MRVAAVFVAGSLLGAAAPALAQSFPPDSASASAWPPFHCGRDPMTDGVGDQSGALQERDVVGTVQAPAGSRAADRDFLYLRLRVNEDPRQGQALRPFAWGFAFSTDNLITSYEVLVTVDGASRTVSLFRNTGTSVLDRPDDPADLPAVASYPFATHGRIVDAQSNLGGSRDYFVEMAIPWRDLATVGLAPDSAVVVWAASSSGADRLDGDFACHDGAAGLARLSESGSTAESTASSPATSTGGSTGAGGQGGSGPGGAGGLTVEGGPGCTYGTGRGSGSISPLLALVGWLARRRRPRP